VQSKSIAYPMIDYPSKFSAEGVSTGLLPVGIFRLIQPHLQVLFLVIQPLIWIPDQYRYHLMSTTSFVLSSRLINKYLRKESNAWGVRLGW
jgi:hypothetical protein